MAYFTLRVLWECVVIIFTTSSSCNSAFQSWSFVFLCRMSSSGSTLLNARQVLFSNNFLNWRNLQQFESIVVVLIYTGLHYSALLQIFTIVLYCLLLYWWNVNVLVTRKNHPWRIPRLSRESSSEIVKEMINYQRLTRQKILLLL